MSARNQSINAGVRNLREFGYPNCHALNITTDFVYAGLFTKMLEESRGLSNPTVDAEINKLLAECALVKAGAKTNK